jgi:hypothetical protein
MGEVKIKQRNIKINTRNTQLYNTETGLLTEIKNADLYKRITTNEVSINYEEYVYLDTLKLKILLAKGIKPVDLALLVTLSCNLLNRYCVCMENEEEPHTTKSIAKLAGGTVQSVKTKLNRLISEGVLAYTISKSNEKWGKVYIMNPHIIRKGVILSKSICEIFDDIVPPKSKVTANMAFDLETK